MTIAFVCNSLNPDLVSYFYAKLRIPEQEVGARLLWFGNRRAAPPSGVRVRTSSVSRSSGFSALFFLDCLISCYVIAVLLWQRVRFVIFDTAHVSNLPVALWCKLFGIRTVFTIHDWEPHPGRRSAVIGLYNRFCRNYLADRIIVFSGVEFEGVPLTRLRLSGFEHRTQEQARNPYFLFFGRIEPYKGLANLLEIAQLLERQSPGHAIWVAGQGRDPSLPRLMERPNVRVINRFIDQAELDALFGGATATLLPYDSASQSGVAVLSYAYDTPVVAFDVGSLAEYIEPGLSGELVPHRDCRGFVARMLQVEKELPRYVTHIRDGFEERYGRSALVAQYSELLRQLNPSPEGPHAASCADDGRLPSSPGTRM